jgi:hypothetical protein
MDRALHLQHPRVLGVLLGHEIEHSNGAHSSVLRVPVANKTAGQGEAAQDFQEDVTFLPHLFLSEVKDLSPKGRAVYVPRARYRASPGSARTGANATGGVK